MCRRVRRETRSTTGRAGTSRPGSQVGLREGCQRATDVEDDQVPAGERIVYDRLPDQKAERIGDGLAIELDCHDPLDRLKSWVDVATEKERPGPLLVVSAV